MKVTYCNCKSEYQDRVYGKNQRAHNYGRKNGYRCTVCGSVKKDGWKNEESGKGKK